MKFRTTKWYNTETKLPDVTKPCPNCGKYHPWASENWAVDELEDEQPEDQRPRKGKRKIKK